MISMGCTVTEGIIQIPLVRMQHPRKMVHKPSVCRYVLQYICIAAINSFSP